MTRTRSWEGVTLDATCRVCKRGASYGVRLERAHVIPRRHDPHGPVDPRAIVTLCRVTHARLESSLYCGGCHPAYDAGDVDLLPYLTHAEQARAVERVGIVSALRYISGRQLADLRLHDEL